MSVLVVEGHEFAATVSIRTTIEECLIDCNRVTFKYGLGEEFIDVLKTLHNLGLDSAEPVRVGGAEVAPRDVVAALDLLAGHAFRMAA